MVVVVGCGADVRAKGARLLAFSQVSPPVQAPVFAHAFCCRLLAISTGTCGRCCGCPCTGASGNRHGCCGCCHSHFFLLAAEIARHFGPSASAPVCVSVAAVFDGCYVDNIIWPSCALIVVTIAGCLQPLQVLSCCCGCFICVCRLLLRLRASPPLRNFSPCTGPGLVFAVEGDNLFLPA